MKKSIESIVSRSVSIVAKFLTLTFLAKVLSLSDYGSFQLISYFVMISVYVYGVEYYMFGNREVAKGHGNDQKINDHLSFFITLFPITFLLQIGALFYLIPQDVLTLKVVLFILSVNFCEYFNQEVYRYLIMVQKIGKANLLLVAKSTVFFILVISFFFLNKDLNLDQVISLMFVSYLILFLITIRFLFKYIIAKEEINLKLLTRKKIGKTFKFLFPFIVLMIFTKGLEFFDKFAIEYFYGTEDVGIYSFLFSIASLIYVFITSGFYLVYLPELIKMHENGESGMKDKIYKYSKLVIGFSVVLIIGVVFTIEFLLNLIGKSELVNNINLLYLLLGSFFLLNLTTIPRILLYVSKKDKDLMKISGVVFISNIILNLILLKYFNIYGAAMALIISYLINFILTFYKGRVVWKIMK